MSESPAIHVPAVAAGPVTHQDVQVRAADHTPLAARFYTPGKPARGAVFIVPAMGVPQNYYAPFAQWLAEHGLHAVTFDYRGMGQSRSGSLRRVDADVVTWAEQDTAAVLRELHARAPGLPITWLGHSLGGQIVPFVRDRPGVTKIITVATGSGYWKQNAAALRKKVWLLWWGVAPVLTPLFGYFPGARLGMVGDLPRGVIEQWRRWCLHPDYSVGDGPETRALYASVTTPMASFSFTDDEMMSEQSIASIHSFYTGAGPVMHRVSPKQVGEPRIGHFGFFRPKMRPHWDALVLREVAHIREG